MSKSRLMPLCELFPGAQSDEERKHLLGVAQRLAQHNLDVWKQAGPYVQTVLVQKIGKMDRNAWGPIRAVLVEVLGETLKTEVHGVSSTYRAVTLSQGSAVPSDALARMRAEAIELLKELVQNGVFRGRKTPNRRTCCFEASRNAKRQRLFE